jgi:hypothetical protein
MDMQKDLQISTNLHTTTRRINTAAILLLIRYTVFFIARRVAFSNNIQPTRVTYSVW